MVAILKGSTSRIIYFEVLDSASTTGGRKTGIAFNAASLTAYYSRNGAAATAITLVTQTAAGAYSSGGWVEVDATNMPGVYRLDVPNAAIAGGVDSVVVTVKGATGMVQVSKEIQLTSVDLQDAVRAGLTALPNANAEAAGGLYTRGSGAGQINQPANGRVDTNVVAVAGTTQTARDLGANLDVVVSTRATPAQILVTPANLLATDASGRVTVGSIVNGAIAAATFAANALGAVWDELRSSHVTAATFGQGVQPLRNGTAQAGAASTITLDAGASATDSFYNNTIIEIIGGTGIGQSRIISAYVGSTKVATVNGNWITNPDNTSVFVILPFGQIPGATAPTAVQNAQAVWDEARSSHTTAGSFGQGVASVQGNVTGSVATLTANNDKTGYALTAGEHTSIATDTQTGLTAQGYTTTRAGYLDTLNGLVAAVWANATRTLSSFGTLVTQVWDEVIPGTHAAGTAGAKLNSASAAGDPWGTAVPGAYAAGTAGSILGNRLDVAVSTRATSAGAGGAGSRSVTITVYKPGGTIPLGSCAVWVTTDLAGTNVVAGTLYTNDSTGQVTFMLDNGAYYYWRQHPGYTFTNPAAITVS